MHDRHARAMLTLIALSTLLMAVTSLWNALPVAHAQSTPMREKCLWTYIFQSGKPHIGADGAVDMQDKNWKKLSDEGWKLTASTQFNPASIIYMFQRCE